MNRLMKSVVVLLFLILASRSGNASSSGAWNALVNASGGVSSYPKVVQELIEDKLYFAAVPYIKEYLTRSSGGGEEN